MRVHIVNGPNLNLLGKREPDVYGTTSFETYFEHLVQAFPYLDLHYFQSNSEGTLIDYLQSIGYEPVAIVFNPAAYTHTSIALADTIKAISAPVVEVHISDIHKRESFRQHSYIAPHTVHRIIGKGLRGYDSALEFCWALE